MKQDKAVEKMRLIDLDKATVYGVPIKRIQDLLRCFFETGYDIEKMTDEQWKEFRKRIYIKGYKT